MIKILAAGALVIAATDQWNAGEFLKLSEARFSALTDELKELLSAEGRYTRSEVIESVSGLLREYTAQNALNPAEGGAKRNANEQATSGALKKALDFIHANYCKDIFLDEAAAHANLSVYHFSRIFKNAMNEKFVDYVIKLRIIKAKELLERSTMKVYEISGAVGYYNLQHFYRIFKANAGCTPIEYRNRNRA
jgi:two-component system response regulator YesN